MADRPDDARAAWHDLAAKELKGDPESLVWATPEGIPVRPLYTAADLEGLEQVANLHAFQARHAVRSEAALRRLQEVARGGGNVFSELMETVKRASLGQICDALFEVGGRYRRSM